MIACFFANCFQFVKLRRPLPIPLHGPCPVWWKTGKKTALVHMMVPFWSLGDKLVLMAFLVSMALLSMLACPADSIVQIFGNIATPHAAAMPDHRAAVEQGVPRRATPADHQHRNYQGI